MPHQQSAQANILCKHCGKPIQHVQGLLWHEQGALVFPQYCVTPKGSHGYSDQLHEPETKQGANHACKNQT